MSTRAQETARAINELLAFPREDLPHLVDTVEEFFTGFNDRDTDSEGSCKSSRIVCVCVCVCVHVHGKRKTNQQTAQKRVK